MKASVNTIFHFYDLSRTTAFAEYHFLFNSASHLRSQSKNNWRVYELVSEQNQHVIARISFYLQSERALSPYKAPFGGLEIYDKVSARELTDFLRFVETDLKNHNVQSICIRLYPEAYHKSVILINDVFLALHYKHSSEGTSIIHVDLKSFERKIKISERQKLRKAKEQFHFEQGNLSQIKEIYSFLSKCRDERNQSLSMTLPELSKTCELFPDHFLLFKVTGNEGIAAACIAVKVSDQFLYTFYYGHLRRYNKISPVVWMMSGIYDYAKINGFKFIDLGTSKADGKVSRSLLHFKKSIGGVSSDKHILEKVLI